MEQQSHTSDAGEHRLDALFRAYRDACPDPEPGATFMPGVWQRIERSKSVSLGFRRVAQGFVTAAATLSLGFALIAVVPNRANSPFSSQSYVEVLADNQSLDNADLFDVPSTTDVGDTDLI